MFSRKILLSLGACATAAAFAPTGPALRVGATQPTLKTNAAARRPSAVGAFFNSPAVASLGLVEKIVCVGLARMVHIAY